MSSIIAQMLNAYVEATGLDDLIGVHNTAIEGVTFHRLLGGERQPLLYQSGIIIVGQGRKEVYLNNQTLQYGPGSALVLGVPMPLECAAFPVDGLPILGLAIDVKPAVLQKLVGLIKEVSPGQSLLHDEPVQTAKGLCSGEMSQELISAVIRLLQALLNPTDAKVLGNACVEEVVYRVMQSKSGHVLQDLAFHDGHYARIARVLGILHQDYANTLSVEKLAEHVNMSVSGFHKAFKDVTLESPVQYLKKVRLGKARELIQTEKLKANEVALAVGYTSVSQFNREFKRHFNATPGAVLKN